MRVSVKKRAILICALALGLIAPAAGLHQAAGQSLYGSAAPPAKPPLTLRIVGSSVKNHKGDYLGRIETVVLNPDTSQSEFAMLLANYPRNTTIVTPVPWSLLTFVSDQSQKGGVPGADQVFQLNIERTNLWKAPVLDKSKWSLIAQPEWRRQVYAFYGYPVGPPSISSTAPAANGQTSYAPPAAAPPTIIETQPAYASAGASASAYAFADDD